MRKTMNQAVRNAVVVATAIAVGTANVPCASAEEMVQGEGQTVAAATVPAESANDSVVVMEPTYDDVEPAKEPTSGFDQVLEPDFSDSGQDSGLNLPAAPVESIGSADGQPSSNTGISEPGLSDDSDAEDEDGSDSVAAGALALDGHALLSASSIVAGASVTITPLVTGASDDVLFNYVWERDGWQSWGSDMNDTGSASHASSKTYTFLVAGTYHLYVDVISGAKTVTIDAGTVTVQDAAWDVSAQLNTSQACPGSEVTLDVHSSGITGDVRFNYVWERDGWQDWGSNVRDGEGYSGARQWSFVPPQAGTYTLYVDIADSSGCIRTITAGQLIVAEDAWSASLGLNSDKVQKGGTIAVTPSVAGTDAIGFTFNYVWNYEGAWAEWGSTVKDTGSFTTCASWDFTPQKAGRYELYVDIKSPAGATRTFSASVMVEPTFEFDKIDCSKTYLLSGQTVTVKPEITGQVEGLTYNYVWNYEGAWAEWGSTVKDTGSATTRVSWDFTPSKPGKYMLYVDAIGSDGYSTTREIQLVVWEAKGLTALSSEGNACWTVSCDLGLSSPEGFTFNYVWKKGSDEGDWTQWGSTVNEEGAMSLQASHTFRFAEEDYYWLYVDVMDPEGNRATVKTKVGYFPVGKAGYQNPSSMYQVSSFNVAPHPNAFGVFSYMTPSRITENATRSDCVEAFIGRAYEYLGTPYVWNYACAPGVGVDCVGLVFQCAYAVGMDLGEFNPYDHQATGATGWHSHDAKNMWDYGKIMRLSMNQRQRGDLIFYSGHVAIYLGDDKVIEALPPAVKISNVWSYGTPLGVGRLFA